MLFNGISAKLKDKRIDRLLKEKGYKDYEVFYSPIQGWLFYMGMMVLISIPFCLYAFQYWYYCLSYFFIGYFMAAFFNNSTVLTKDQLLIVNLNFPFKKFESFELDSITEIYIDKNRKLFFLYFFIMGSNFIELRSLGKKQRYYCVSLEEDFYDENITEKTLDDLVLRLRERNMNVVFKI